MTVFIVVMLAFQWLQDLTNVTNTCTTKKYPHTIIQKEKKLQTLFQYKNLTPRQAQETTSFIGCLYAKCYFDRESPKVLLKDVNEQKRTIKNQGIFVDGIKVNIEFDGKMFLLVYCMKVVCKNNPDLF